MVIEYTQAGKDLKAIGHILRASHESSDPLGLQEYQSEIMALGYRYGIEPLSKGIPYTLRELVRIAEEIIEQALKNPHA